MKKLLALLLFALFSNTSKACVCSVHLGIDTVDYVFIGQVIGMNKRKIEKDIYEYFYYIRIITAYKGDYNAGDTIKIKPYFHGCNFVPDREKLYYAFYGNVINNELRFSKCSQTKNIKKKEIKTYVPKNTEPGF